MNANTKPTAMTDVKTSTMKNKGKFTLNSKPAKAGPMATLN